MSPKTIIIMVLGLLLLYGLFTIGLPFLLALVTAIFLDPLTVSYACRGKMSRSIAATIVSTAFTLAIRQRVVTGE